MAIANFKLFLSPTLLLFVLQIHSVWLPSPIHALSLIFLPWCMCNTTVRYSGLVLSAHMKCADHCAVKVIRRCVCERTIGKTKHTYL